MATLFEKIKNALGFYPKATYYKMDETTAEPVKAEYAPAPKEEVDFSKMTRAQLVVFAKASGIKVKSNAKKQAIIEAIKLNQS